MRTLHGGWLGLVAAAIVLLPTSAHAQSAIAGVVRDSSGGVLPGVNVEAKSPALIEGARSVITDSAGQYRIVDLRPGTYVVTFTLQGFNAVRREGIELPSNFTADVNADMRVGALEETVTVSGASPIVDIRGAEKRSALSQELLTNLPSARSWDTNTQAFVIKRPEVGGSTATTVSGGPKVYVYGSLDTAEIMIDGMSVMAGVDNPGLYASYDSMVEMTYALGGGSAEQTSGALNVNMIPREGGNTFSGDATAIYANHSMQGSNYTTELKNRGLAVPPGLAKSWDGGANFGGPIVRDKLWFFTQYRDWAFNQRIANAFNADGSQAAESNHLYSVGGRLTYQMSKRNKLTGFYEKDVKNIGHYDLIALEDPIASSVWNTDPSQGNSQAKWTSTISDRLLIEVGWGLTRYKSTGLYQPEVRRATCFVPFNACAPGTDYGDIAKVDLISGARTGSYYAGQFGYLLPNQRVPFSVSYVTGSHAFKAGGQTGWGVATYGRTFNADLVQQYRNGVADSVQVRNSPNVDETTNFKYTGLYVQDSWTTGRFTLSPGLRWDHLDNSFPDVNQPAGRFVAARHFAAQSDVIDYNDLSPRLGAAYNVGGRGKTAIKASFGKYVTYVNSFASKYNPVVESTDTRRWSDLNGDNIAQENEIGPSTNLLFGIKAPLNPDPDQRRPYSLLYSVGVDHELAPRIGLSVSYNRRTFHRILWTNNLATTFADYTLITIPDPRNNGQTLPVYNLSPSKLGLVNSIETNTDNNHRVYNGFDIALNARIGDAGRVTISDSTGRILTQTCEVTDPNSLRFCDQTQFHVPFKSSFRAGGTYRLRYGVLLSAVFQSSPNAPTLGDDTLQQNYIVNRAIIPNLTQTSVTVPLNAPGSSYRQRINQLDMTVGKEFRVGKNRLLPKVEFFNLLNANPVLAENQAFGPTLGQPSVVLLARFFRVNLRVDF
jgi:Carboxypeptidase regulatory-like domain